LLSNIRIMESQKSESIILDFKVYFRGLWKESKPLVRLFRTSSRGYLYDTGTNKILECDDIEFDLLSRLLTMSIDRAIDSFVAEYGNDRFVKTAEKIKNAIQNENILLTKNASQFGLSAHYHNFEELVATSLGLLNLEVTENCNLRCDYCVYNPHFHEKRNHGSERMPLSVAQLAIQYLKDHSSQSENVYIAYYGGEPLLEFDLIESCLKFAQDLFQEKQIGYSITTNATLITPKVAELLFRNKFKVTVSLDGPEKIHDSYRKDICGNGSFKKTIKGLENLINAYGEEPSKNIVLNMVYTPPYSGQKLERISELWNEIPWLPRNIKARLTYPSPGSIPKERLLNADTWEDWNFLQWSYGKYADSYLGKGNSHPIANSLLEQNLAFLIQRPIYEKPLDKYYLNGCCIPAVRRLYVSAQGRFHICEKITTNAPTIGSVFSGIDLKILKKVYIEEYDRLSLQICSDCWALRLCDACYIHAFENGQLDSTKKKMHCSYVLHSKETFLNIFCELLEQNKEGLNYLAQYKIS